MSKLPVVIFGFNRPDKMEGLLARLTVERPSQIYAFLDGPRNEADEAPCNATQQIVKRYAAQLPMEVVIRPQNTGFDYNIPQGISVVLEQHTQAVIFEDDIHPLKGCLAYLEKALDVYRHRPEIFSIGCYHGLPSLPTQAGNAALSWRFNCWGWATWRDRWGQIAPLLATSPYKHYYQIPYRAGADIPIYFGDGRKLPSWDVVSALHYLKNGWLQVQPKKDLIRNMGHDGSGYHCVFDSDRLYKGFDFDAPLDFDPTVLDPSIQLDPAIEYAVRGPYKRYEAFGWKALRRAIRYHLRMILGSYK